MTHGVFFDLLFCSACTIGIIILFMVCGIIFFLRRNRKSDLIKIIAGILMGICFFVFLFLLWCVIGFGSNVPDTEPKPSGYCQSLDLTAERYVSSNWDLKEKSCHLYELMR